MATFEYGAPNPAPVPVRVSTPTTVAAARPRCWGKSFDETDRECRGCGFQNSCKDELIRNNVNRPVTQPVPSYYAPQPVRPYATPQPVQPLQQVIPSYPYPQPPPTPVLNTLTKALAPVLHPQQPHQVHGAPISRHGYGWLQDPLYYTIHSAPPPMRAQMAGETFLERVVKNAALAMLEKGAAECFLAIRQMILAPTMPVPTVEIRAVEPGVGQGK